MFCFSRFWPSIWWCWNKEKDNRQRIIWYWKLPSNIYWPSSTFWFLGISAFGFLYFVFCRHILVLAVKYLPKCAKHLRLWTPNICAADWNYWKSNFAPHIYWNSRPKPILILITAPHLLLFRIRCNHSWFFILMNCCSALLTRQTNVILLSHNKPDHRCLDFLNCLKLILNPV